MLRPLDAAAADDEGPILELPLLVLSGEYLAEYRAPLRLATFSLFGNRLSLRMAAPPRLGLEAYIDCRCLLFCPPPDELGEGGWISPLTRRGIELIGIPDELSLPRER